MTKVEFEQHHVLFQSDDRKEYIGKMLSNVLRDIREIEPSQ